MSKFLLNLLLQISKALVNSKIQLLIQKSFSLLSAQPTLRSVRPLAQPAHWPRCSPQTEIVPAGPSSRASVASSREICFPFQITPSRAGHLSLVSLSTGPHLSESPPSPCRSTPVGNFPTPLLPRAAAPRLGCPRAFTTLAHHSPPTIPFKPSLNAFNGVKAINVGD
jgi:hypothetical protein